jgi:hypothetical protein
MDDFQFITPEVNLFEFKQGTKLCGQSQAQTFLEQEKIELMLYKRQVTSAVQRTGPDATWKGISLWITFFVWITDLR